jgi:hypothetical protein
MANPGAVAHTLPRPNLYSRRRSSRPCDEPSSLHVQPQLVSAAQTPFLPPARTPPQSPRLASGRTLYDKAGLVLDNAPALFLLRLVNPLELDQAVTCWEIDHVPSAVFFS